MHLKQFHFAGHVNYLKFLICISSEIISLRHYAVFQSINQVLSPHNKKYETCQHHNK